MFNCSNKTVMFSSILSSKSITPINLYISSLSIDYCGKKSQAYVLLSTNVLESEKKLNEISVVRKYLDLFPEDILEFEVEIGFSIDLVLGMGPISIAPYRMSPLELA